MTLLEIFHIPLLSPILNFEARLFNLLYLLKPINFISILIGLKSFLFEVLKAIHLFVLVNSLILKLFSEFHQL